MAQVGQAEGHDVHIELAELQKAAKQANRLKKLPSEYGHNFGEGLDKALGYFYNVRMDGNKMVGDLQIFESADKSPTHPGMGSHILALASEDKSRVNSSIKFYPGEKYQRDSTGLKIRVSYYNQDSGWVSPLEEYGNVYREIQQLKGCDMVGDGALTEELYSTQDQMLSNLHQIIYDERFPALLETHGEELTVLAEFYHKKESEGLIATFKNFISDKFKTPMDTKPTPEPTLQEKHDALAAELAEFKSGKKKPDPVAPTLQEQFEALQTELEEFKSGKRQPEPAAPTIESALQVQFDALKKEIAELQKGPAAPETRTETTEDPPADPKQRAYSSMPIHQQAIAKGLGEKASA